MKKRILGGVILFVLLVPALIIGGRLFKIVTTLISFGAIYELIKTTTKTKLKSIYVLAFMYMFSLMHFHFVKGILNIDILTPESLRLSMLVLFLSLSLPLRDRFSANDSLKVVGIIAFLSYAFTTIMNIYFDSIYKLIFIVLIATMTDIFALVGGMLIGKHKLTTISPKKTIEGSLTGLIVCTIVTTTYYLIAMNKIGLKIIPIIIILSIVGQIGDLFFSQIKRENNIKDYSNLIPGHGGILDRFDSLIFIALVYGIFINVI
jgi:phosphatidate cytidylyltransferase